MLYADRERMKSLLIYYHRQLDQPNIPQNSLPMILPPSDCCCIWKGSGWTVSSCQPTMPVYFPLISAHFRHSQHRIRPNSCQTLRLYPTPPHSAPACLWYCRRSTDVVYEKGVGEKWHELPFSTSSTVPVARPFYIPSDHLLQSVVF